VIAALSQIGVAIAVTLPVLIAVLGTVAGILIVGVGGGLIAPMRQRWETILNRAEQEAPRAAAEARNNHRPGPRRRRSKVDANVPTAAMQSAPTEEMSPVDTGASRPPGSSANGRWPTPHLLTTTSRSTSQMITQDQLQRDRLHRRRPRRQQAPRCQHRAPQPAAGPDRNEDEFRT
jgi:hypothetical protein